MDPRTTCYTETILQAIRSTLDATAFMCYMHIIRRVLQGEISSAASLPALGYNLNRHPKAIFLHNEVAAMTHDAMLVRNLPNLYDNGSDSNSSSHCRSLNSCYGEQLLDTVDHFASTEGARPAEANAARDQVMRYLNVVMQGQQEAVRAVGDLAADMASMAV